MVILPTMNKKGLYLFIALLVPVLIFVFLKFFGKNQFDIPIYYQNGLDSLSTTCQVSFPKPYVLPDSIPLLSGYQAHLLSLDTTRVAEKYLSGIGESFDANEVGVTSINSFPFSTAQVERLKSCVLMLNPPWTVVLIDNQRRIRGYYNPKTQEETDRMVVELKILLKKY